MAVIWEALAPAPLADMAALIKLVVAPALVATWARIVVVAPKVKMAVIDKLQPEPEAEGW